MAQTKIDLGQAGEQLVTEVYEKVLQIAARALHNCKTVGFRIEVLRLENPTYADIAKNLGTLAQLLSLIDDDSELKVTKAHEYVGHIRLIASAIEQGDEALLREQCDSLNRRSFL